ncbi:MAG: DUF3267 domain-containing protein [Clostridia bacterium]|nr:DUF3267 domain-containing protein [Clostridia bacterium]
MPLIVEILIAFLTQVAFTVGIIWLFGFLISLCNRIFYGSFGILSQPLCYITGFIGTPVHECAHALFCLIFGHRIDEMALFQIDSDDGTLGYVKHSYNPRNVYHLIGNFFIGIAPIVVITAILHILSSFLVPDMLSTVLTQIRGINLEVGFSENLPNLFGIFTAMFAEVGNYKFWIFFVIAIFLCLHMTLSGADIKNALGGVGILVGALLVTDIIVGLISKTALDSITSFTIFIGGYLASFLAFAFIISFIAMVFSLIFRMIFRRIL